MNRTERTKSGSRRAACVTEGAREPDRRDGLVSTEPPQIGPDVLAPVGAAFAPKLTGFWPMSDHIIFTKSGTIGHRTNLNRDQRQRPFRSPGPPLHLVLAARRQHTRCKESMSIFTYR